MITDPSAAVQTHELTKRFGATRALDGLTMEVRRGEVFGFLGPNGAGKTTALKLLLGLSRATSGQARVLGLPPGDRGARRRVGYLPERFRYQPWLSGREVLVLHARLAALPRDGWQGEADRVLALLDLTAAADRRVSTYSKGMEQRLGIAAALLGGPELLLLDEPTSALDPLGRAEIRELLRGLRSTGTAVLLNSHLLGEVEQVCDHVAIVDRGRIVAAGTLDELLSGNEVRVRVTGPLPDAQTLAGFGAAALRDGWIAVPGLDPDRVPQLVDAFVAAGTRVHAVESRRETLEERFRALVDPG